VLENLKIEREQLKQTLHGTTKQSKELFEENIELLKMLKEF